MLVTESPSRMLQPGSTRWQTRIVLVAGFGGILVLLAVFGISAISFLSQIKTHEETIRGDYIDREGCCGACDLISLPHPERMFVTFFLDTNDAFAAGHSRSVSGYARPDSRGSK